MVQAAGAVGTPVEHLNRRRARTTIDRNGIRAMTIRNELAQSAILCGVFLLVFALGFGAVWLEMRDVAQGLRSEVSDIHTEISSLTRRVSRIEAHLGMPAPAPGAERAASDPARRGSSGPASPGTPRVGG